MLSKKEALAHAKQMSELHNEPWIIFKTPKGAAINQYPLNIYNTGRYATCRLSEREEYEAGGCEFENEKE